MVTGFIDTLIKKFDNKMIKICEKFDPDNKIKVPKREIMNIILKNKMNKSRSQV